MIPLNDFLRTTARQHREKGLSNSFVLLDEEAPRSISGLFTICFLEVDVASLPREHTRRLPKPARLPAAKLARLAIDRRHQGKGYGTLLLADAVKRVVTTARESGAVVGFFVDAKDDQARRFYLRFGFVPLRDAPLSLYLPLATLVAGVDCSFPA